MDEWDGCTVEAGAGSYPEPPVERKESSELICDECHVATNSLLELGEERLCNDCYYDRVHEIASNATKAELLAYLEPNDHNAECSHFLTGYFFKQCLSPIEQWSILFHAFKERVDDRVFGEDWMYELRRYISRNWSEESNFADWLMQRKEAENEQSVS